MKLIKRQKQLKSHKYEIDQSGKIEQTQRHTVIAYSNSNKYAVLISRKLKRQLKDVFDKKIPPNRVLFLEDIIKALKKTDGRLRECLSTLVDAQARSMNKKYHKGFKKSRGRIKKAKNG